MAEQGQAWLAALRRHSGKIGFLAVAIAIVVAVRLGDPELASSVDAAVPAAGEIIVDGGIAAPTIAVTVVPLDTPREPPIDTSFELSFQPTMLQQTVEVEPGDTLLAMLVDAGVPQDDAYSAIDALGVYFEPQDLRPGQEIELTFMAPEKDPDEGKVTFELASLAMQPSVERDVGVTRSDDGAFEAFVIDKPLTESLAYSEAVIDSSLFEAGQEAGIPLAVLTEAIRAYSFDVDFQREIQVGDSFSLVYQRFEDEDGNLAKTGELLYASLTLSGKTLEIYRYLPQSGIADYFNPSGNSVRKALLRTPVDGARLTSGFGMRTHPILGYSKMHKGADFGAPAGTPIYAAGSGVIVQIGKNGGYGNYIQIRHNSEYSTAYAHMKGFAKGLTDGSRVEQGEVIGYVGSTGRSTGPHLHYEVLVAGEQVNPLSIKLPAGEKLEGADLEAFLATVGTRNALRDDLRIQWQAIAAASAAVSDCTQTPKPSDCSEQP